MKGEVTLLHNAATQILFFSVAESLLSSAAFLPQRFNQQNHKRPREQKASD